MKRAAVPSILVVVVLVAVAVIAEAQQPAKTPRIAYLSSSSIISANTEAFQQGLRDLGYIEGKNIVIEWRFAEGNRDRLRALKEVVPGVSHIAVLSNPTNQSVPALLRET